MKYHGPTRVYTDGDAAQSYIARALRVVSNLKDRIKGGGIEVGSTVVDLDDGVTVRASVAGDAVTQVQISAKGKREVPCDSCPIYMESGVLDIGVNTNTSGFINPYQQPIYADAQPPLYFGDYTRCGGGRPEGLASVATCADNTATFSGGCQGAHGVVSIPANACKPVSHNGAQLVSRLEKLTCQGRVPASLFTGIMQRWVQALYGSPTAIYRSTTGLNSGWPGTPAVWLQAMDSKKVQWVNFTWAPIGASGCYGIVDFGGANYRFVEAYQDHVIVYKTSLTPCGKKLQKIVAAMSNGNAQKRARRQRVEAYLLSQLTIDLTKPFETINYAATIPNPLCYSWKFHPWLPKMSLVGADQSTSESAVYTKTFSLDHDGHVVITDIATTPKHISVIGAEFPDVVINNLDNRTSLDGVKYGFTNYSHSFNTLDASIVDVDAPIYCWYLQDGTLEVVNIKFVQGGSSTNYSTPCWPDFYYGKLPNMAPNTTSINDPCEVGSAVNYRSGVCGFYTARYSNVSFLAWGANTSGGGTAPNNSQYQGNEYIMHSNPTSPVQTHNSTPPAEFIFNTNYDGTPGSIPSVPSTGEYHWNTRFQGCYSDSLITQSTPHGCTITVGGPHSMIDGPFGQDDYKLVCPAQTGCANITGEINISTFWHHTISFNCIGGTVEQRGAGWAQADGANTVLIVPSGSASACWLVSSPFINSEYSAGRIDSNFMMSATASSVLDVAGATISPNCKYAAYPAPAPPPCPPLDGTVTYTAPPDISIPGVTEVGPIDGGPVSVCVMSGGDRGWSNGEDDPFNPYYQPSVLVGSGQGHLGSGSFSAKLLGYAVASVIDIPAVSGSHFLQIGTYTLGDAAISCLPNPTDPMTGTNNPMMSMTMFWGNYPADATDISNGLFGSYLGDNVFGASQGMSFQCLTSAGGDIAYFNDWPALRGSLADNNLTMTGNYPYAHPIVKPSFVGWA